MKLNTIRVGWDNPLYIIVYTNDITGEVGMDYTTNLIEFKDLLEFHETNTTNYQVHKVLRKKED